MNTLPSEQPTTDPPPIANYQPKLILDPSNLERDPIQFPKNPRTQLHETKNRNKKTSNRNKIKPHSSSSSQSSFRFHPPPLSSPLRINWRSTFNPLPSDNLAVSPPDSATRVDEAHRERERGTKRERERERTRATPHRGRKSKNRPHKSPRTMAPIVCTMLNPLPF